MGEESAMTADTPVVATVGVLAESSVQEPRVALVPDDVAKLLHAHVRLVIERQAGARAFFDDSAYESAGASLEGAPREVLLRSDVIAMVRPPADPAILGLLRQNSVVIGFLDPSRDSDLVRMLADRGITAFAMELIPRITRAQSMDALSSMSTIAGYRAVLIAAEASKRMFPMLITAAGTQAPCRVLVLGAGVAGLQALATAKRLGAVTSGFDTRPDVREQVQSVGAAFVRMEEGLQVEGTQGGYAQDVGDEFLRRERESIRPHVAAADAVITTALIPGHPAPVLISTEMVGEMKPGAVIVDLAAEQGGNCELTKAGETVVANGVTILGPINLAGQAATQASQMYSRNMANVIRLLIKEGGVAIDFDDEIVREACVTHAGRVLT